MARPDENADVDALWAPAYRMPKRLARPRTDRLQEVLQDEG